jgi:hypothetical protein
VIVPERLAAPTTDMAPDKAVSAISGD